MLPSHPKALLLSNPNCRVGTFQMVLQAKDLLRAAGFELHHVESASAQQAGQTITQHATDVDLAIIVGGDGTLHSVAEPLLRSGLPLGIIPAGTANDLARSLSIPPDVHQACGIITRGYTKRIDLGSVNGCYFFNAVNIGLGVDITHSLTPEVKRTWGVLSYLKAFFESLTRRQSFRVSLVIDDRRLRLRTIHIGVGNGRYYGGGNVINEQAKIDDGRLWLYSLKPQSVWELLALAPLLRGGKHRRVERVFCASAQKIRIATTKPKEVHADGEPVAVTPVTIQCHADSLTVFAPAEGDDDTQPSVYQRTPP